MDIAENESPSWKRKYEDEDFVVNNKKLNQDKETESFYSQNGGETKHSGRGFESSEEQNVGQIVDDNSPIIQAFRQYQKELDARHDKYERLVKKSRDVTIESKRIIFLLHRIRSDENRTSILEEANQRLTNVQVSLLKDIAEELVNEDIYQYLRAYTSGVQEFIEALTFYHYEVEKRLITLPEILHKIEENILNANKESPPSEEILHQIRQLIPPAEYILGVADLTGELMRKCITATGAEKVEMSFELCKLLRELHDGFITIGTQGTREINHKLITTHGTREINHKLITLKQSLAKVETACYTLHVRGSEIPKHKLGNVFTMNNSDYIEEQEDADD